MLHMNYRILPPPPILALLVPIVYMWGLSDVVVCGLWGAGIFVAVVVVVVVVGAYVILIPALRCCLYCKSDK